jgi:AcrR family transcriptional regulator
VVADTDTRERILEAALGLFAAQGYQRTSLRQIAERLGLSKAAVLYHFPAKDRILSALTEPMLADLEAALDRADRLDRPACRRAVLEGLLDAFLAHRQELLMLRHDGSIITQRGDVYHRFLNVASRAHRMIAGPDAALAEQVHAAQAVACLGDPVLYFADAPVDDLREIILDSARRMLGEAVAADRAPRSAGADPPRAASHKAAPRRTGRPRSLDGERLASARRMYATGTQSVTEIAASLGVSRATLYRHLDRHPDRASHSLKTSTF